MTSVKAKHCLGGPVSVGGPGGARPLSLFHRLSDRRHFSANGTDHLRLQCGSMEVSRDSLETTPRDQILGTSVHDSYKRQQEYMSPSRIRLPRNRKPMLWRDGLNTHTSGHPSPARTGHVSK